MTIARAHFILFVHDQAASTAFFSAVLKIAPRLEVPGMTELELPGGAVLGLMPEAGITNLLGDAMDPRRANGAPRAELYLMVDDPTAYLARALEAGAMEVSPLTQRDWGHIAGYVRDLDGHLLAFAREA